MHHRWFFFQLGEKPREFKVLLRTCPLQSKFGAPQSAAFHDRRLADPA
jgi:hypothetical protein